MALRISRLRRWFAFGAILMIGIVAGMYFLAQWSLRKAVHAIPAKLGIDIQQTAEGFSISKSVEGRTLFKVSASKAVQFKEGGRAELHNVKIIVYGRDASRFDRITGDDFEYDPTSGNINAKGQVLIDLESNPEGLRHADQSPPQQLKEPIHLETNGLIFNKNTGDASASGKVVFQTPQASGSAVGVSYEAKSGTMNLLSDVDMTVNRPQPAHLTADHGIVTKQPHQVLLTAVRMSRQHQQVKSDQATFFLRDDNTVERILAEGDVESEVQSQPSSRSKASSKARSKTSANISTTETRERSDRAELFLTGMRNQLTEAILTGNVQLDALGEQPAHASAGRVTMHFVGQQILKTVHAEDGVRLSQKNSGAKAVLASSTSSAKAGSKNQEQDIEMTAPVMDFIVKNGRVLENAETSGPPQILITQHGTNQETVVTAGKFIARFTDKNRLATLHGEPDAKIVNRAISNASRSSSAPPPPDRVSTSRMLDVVFLPESGVSSVTQTGSLTYVDGPEKAWAQSGEYTTSDQMLVLNDSPRIVDGGMTTTAQVVRMNRATGDAIAEGNVKSTYSDLKMQPDGGMLASSDPIHVTSRTMTAHRSSAIALYTGDARLWQNANIVEAPVLQFDRDHRSLVAQAAETSTPEKSTPGKIAPANSSQPVSTVLVQVDKTGKVTPVRVTSARLNYIDADRRVFLDGGVTAKAADTTMTAERMTVYLLPRDQSKAGASPSMPGQIDRIIAEDKVVVTQPARHANGERLVYTAGDDKFVLTGGTPSIFDAERGKITGNSLTFYRHDDRVLVEGRATSPTITKTQVAR